LALTASAVVVSARAADLPVAPSYYPPAAVLPPAQYNWTGVYFGGHVGAGLLSDNFTPTTPLGTIPVAGSTSVGPVGLIGGAQAGVNFEFAHWVIGAEASWTASNISGTGIATPAATAPAGAFQKYTSAPSWIAAATGRVGYAANDVLFYVKGGGAVMEAHYTENDFFANVSINNQRSGYTAGAGIEYGLTENLSAKLEYDFYGFGTKSYNSSNFPQTPVSIRSDLQTLAFGLNYRFNWVKY
jgi:outer membrane immunogenic protein